MIVLPATADLPAYRQVSDLAGRGYRLRFYWNTRDAAWYVDLLADDGTAILYGRPLRLSWPIFRQFVDVRLPEGDLIAADMDGTGTEPGRNDLGGRVPLLFAETGEV